MHFRIFSPGKDTECGYFEGFLKFIFWGGEGVGGGGGALDISDIFFGVNGTHVDAGSKPTYELAPSGPRYEEKK